MQLSYTIVPALMCTGIHLVYLEGSISLPFPVKFNDKKNGSESELPGPPQLSQFYLRSAAWMASKHPASNIANKPPKLFDF